jgi:glycosyltransferase involved in cell wall biosynthesis
VSSAVRLAPELRTRLDEIRHADLVVGIPSYNNASTIGHVVRAVIAGLAKHFPDQRAVLINSDGGSSDATHEVVAAATFSTPEAILVAHPLTPVHKILTPYHGLPGKGSAFRTIFAVARELEAKGCAVVDSDLRSITPEWVELLLGPVVRQDFDYVSPLYFRHKYDGTITNSIVYPLTRALYGKDVRQPIGGDFGFSGRLASHYLEKPVWESNVARFGIDIWMTTTAIADEFKVCQSFLGAKIHDAKDPGADLADMFVQVVSSVFDLMVTYESKWKAINGAENVPLFGFPHGVGVEPVNVNVERMVGIFRQAVRDLPEIWALALEPSTLREITALATLDTARFSFPPSLWVRTIYDFAVAYRRPPVAQTQLLKALVPLYLGRTASFILETVHSDAVEVERIIHGLGEEYVANKGYLVRRWADPTGRASA